MADKRHEKQALAERFGAQACLFVTVWVMCLPLARATLPLTDVGTVDQSTGSLRRGRALLQTPVDASPVISCSTPDPQTLDAPPQATLYLNFKAFGFAVYTCIGGKATLSSADANMYNPEGWEGTASGTELKIGQLMADTNNFVNVTITLGPNPTTSAQSTSAPWARWTVASQSGEKPPRGLPEMSFVKLYDTIGGAPPTNCAAGEKEISFEGTIDLYTCEEGYLAPIGAPWPAPMPAMAPPPMAPPPPKSPPPPATSPPPPTSFAPLPTPAVESSPPTIIVMSTPPPPTTSSAGTASIAAIAGAVVGGVCILGAAGVWFAVRARKRIPTPQPQEEKEVNEKMPKGVTRPEDSLVLTVPGPSPLPPPPPSDPVLRWIDSRGVSLRSTHSPPNTRQGEPPAGEVPAYVRDLEFAWSEVRVMKALGFGSFGKVFLAEVGHAQVAVKLLLDAKTVASDSAAAVQTGSAVPTLQGPDVAVASRAALVNEVAAMAPLHHANVVHLLGFCTAPPALATEYCSRGSMFDLLQKGRCDPETASWLSWSVRLRMAADSAAGMHHLHTRSPPIVHRDLKTPNLLVAGDWVVKVADMGLSKLVVDAMHASTAGGATNPRWLAPEAFRGERLTAASDVFSFGVVMWELLTWRVPWDDANPMAIPVAVVRGDRLAVPEMAALPGFSDGDRRTHASSVASYVALMRRCWAADPSARPTFSDIAAELRAASS